MPVAAGVAEADRFAVLDHVGDDQNLRMAGQEILSKHMDHQRAEAAAEGDMLLRRDSLVAEYEHAVAGQECLPNSGKSSVVERIGKIEIANFGA